MDIFIPNVPQDVNHIELQIFLKDRLHNLDVLVFEIRKFNGRNARPYAILTVPSVAGGTRFLQYHGSRGRGTALMPLVFRGKVLVFQKSNKPGQPEPLKIRTLQEKEAAMRSKMGTQATTVQTPRSSRSTLAFLSLMTGVWNYDHLGKLFFDQKFKDRRQGYITFGKTALVVYLQADVREEFNWHCRIDIPYLIMEHVIPSFDNGQRGAITFTLKSPPKFYKIRSTEDLHLYAGEEAPKTADILPGFAALDLGAKPTQKTRLERLCGLNRVNNKNSALCMVYKLTFIDTRSAQHAWNFVKEFSVPEVHCWKVMTPTEPTNRIEVEYAIIEKDLSAYNPSIPNEFDFAVRYQLMALILEGTVSPMRMPELMRQVQHIAKQHGAEFTASAVKRLGQQIPTPAPDTDAKRFDIQTLVGLMQEIIQDSKSRELTSRDLNKKQKKHHHLALTYKATVTPTGILLRGPDWGVSNRILRKYATHTEYFMRVFFADEDGLSVFHDSRATQEEVYKRFRTVLMDGISVAGRMFQFLGFSHASLRCHQTWFMAPFVKDGVMVRARDIIRDLGDFSHIHCSAKCAARIGQSFSDTIFSVPVPTTAYVTETKVDVVRNGRTFSDGCGTISLDLLQKVWRALPPERREQRPTILQIRYRGAKGVLSLDKSLEGQQLHVRESMTKYIAKESWRDLELCGAAYRPLMVFLNHQFIKILEDLGVPAENFKAVQDDAVNTLKMITEHPLNAASFLEYSHSSVFAKVPRLFELMYQIGLSFHADRFLTDIVEVAAMSNLRSLKYRARIPVTNGFLLYGIMDETNTLREGEVYIPTQQYDANGVKKRSILLGKRIVITRAPALHPGDVQLVEAVDVPMNSPLRALHNCVVFSQRGPRDLPSQLSGGDLDGDLFHVIYDTRLIPDSAMPPADYASTAAKDLKRPVVVEDIVDFFIEYMNMDRLGQISNKHKIRADIKPAGTLDDECILLAKLASDAVDFSKSGVPADMSQIPRGTDHFRPDFMAPGSNLVINNLGAAELEELEQDDIDDPDGISVLDADKLRYRYYRSDKILGVLYRAIDEKKFFDRMKNDFEAFRRTWGGETLVQKLKKYVVRETRGIQWDHHWDFAEQLREEYEENMLEIMDTLRPTRGSPLTELEVFSGNILGKKERAPSRYIREANLEVQERFNRDVSAMVRRVIVGDGDWEDSEGTETLPRSIACFMVALETEGWENYRSLQSWKYVAASVCLEQLWKYRGGRLRRL
ncbi:RdRP-domain-containing protein [Decorospora gaudefroyi]|uniref:RNA-dependent RNA polymerase n=1 Tax=Decorospora gaudefroyi TaxID=184978 RepID=A0A6A5L0H4_9PLEO|nr:RdRP-domain-containing protein [Decorospora gaudefroyi]